MTETYKGSFFCLNCDWKGDLDVSKGTTKHEFTRQVKCPGCDTQKLSVG